MTQPQFLILPTSDIVADFFKDVKNMTNHDYDLGEIIKDTFACLSILHDIDDNLAAACDKIVKGYVRAHGEDDGLVLANAFGNFARSIKAVFHVAEAWDSNGILRIFYYEAIRDDWVVEVDSCTQVNKIGRGLTTPIVEWGSDADYDKFLEATRNTLPIPKNAINEGRTGVKLYPTDNYGGKIVGKPICIYGKEKVNNENNPEQ